MRVPTKGFFDSKAQKIELGYPLDRFVFILKLGMRFPVSRRR